MATFGKKGATRPTVRVEYSPSNGRRVPYLGAGMLIMLLGAVFGGLGTFLAPATSTFFSGLFILASVLLGLSTGLSLRSAWTRLFAGRVVSGAAAAVETCVCAGAQAVMLAIVYDLEQHVRLGGFIPFLIVAAPGVAIIAYAQKIPLTGRLTFDLPGRRSRMA